WRYTTRLSEINSNTSITKLDGTLGAEKCVWCRGAVVINHTAVIHHCVVGIAYHNPAMVHRITPTKQAIIDPLHTGYRHRFAVHYPIIDIDDMGAHFKNGSAALLLIKPPVTYALSVLIGFRHTPIAPVVV